MDGALDSEGVVRENAPGITALAGIKRGDALTGVRMVGVAAGDAALTPPFPSRLLLAAAALSLLATIFAH